MKNISNKIFGNNTFRQIDRFKIYAYGSQIPFYDPQNPIYAAQIRFFDPQTESDIIKTRLYRRVLFSEPFLPNHRKNNAFHI